jgi:peptide deformylase
MIITNNEEALRIKCEDATPDEVGAIIEQLESELTYSAKMGRPGIGLAAPQIGIAKNVAIVRINDVYQVNLVNCRIKNQYDPIIFKGEGCLSFPGRIENTSRYQEIHIIDNLVHPYMFMTSGLMAIVAQHELDHLNSILLSDKALPKLKIKTRPNDPCICGKIDPITGNVRKYKKCCGKT